MLCGCSSVPSKNKQLHPLKQNLDHTRYLCTQQEEMLSGAGQPTETIAKAKSFCDWSIVPEHPARSKGSPLLEWKNPVLQQEAWQISLATIPNSKTVKKYNARAYICFITSLPFSLPTHNHCPKQ